MPERLRGLLPNPTTAGVVVGDVVRPVIYRLQYILKIQAGYLRIVSAQQVAVITTGDGGHEPRRHQAAQQSDTDRQRLATCVHVAPPESVCTTTDNRTAKSGPRVKYREKHRSEVGAPTYAVLRAGLEHDTTSVEDVRFETA